MLTLAISAPTMDLAADVAAVAVARDAKGPEMELERYAASPYGF